jgi:hypothetical protein
VRPCSTTDLETYLADPVARRLLRPADCYTFILLDGTTLRYTAWQRDITAVPVLGGPDLETWKANGVKIDGLRFDTKIGADVDSQTITISATAADLVKGLPFLQQLRLGRFRGARLKRDRFYIDAAGAVIGGVPIFWGRVSTLDSIGRIEAKVVIKSDTVILDMQMPRRLYQASCLHTLYDGGCKLDSASFVDHGVVGASPSATTIPYASATANIYDLGKIFFESGPNIGEWALIKHSTGSAFILASPLPFTPLAGDNFAAYQGCTKDYGGRCLALANQANNVSFPFVPVAESAF